MVQDNFQDPKFVHSMNKLVNAAYFSKDVINTEYGYAFYSKYSKIKNKHVITNDGFDFSYLEGEIITPSKFSGSSKAVEILYNIDQIFSRHNYENKKKYQNRIKSPLTLCDRLSMKVREATFDDLANITSLHSQWVEHKLSDPRVHKITFSSKRYINCVIDALNNKRDYICLVFEVDNKINGCRVIAVNVKIAFDLAFFSEFWSVSQLTEAQNILSLQYLLNNNIKYLNTGLAGGSLKKYKQQYPHQQVYVYRKNQLKHTSELNTLLDI